MVSEKTMISFFTHHLLMTRTKIKKLHQTRKQNLQGLG